MMVIFVLVTLGNGWNHSYLCAESYKIMQQAKCHISILTMFFPLIVPQVIYIGYINSFLNFVLDIAQVAGPRLTPEPGLTACQAPATAQCGSRDHSSWRHLDAIEAPSVSIFGNYFGAPDPKVFKIVTSPLRNTQTGQHFQTKKPTDRQLVRPTEVCGKV